MKIIADMPTGWKPALCRLCSADFACHTDYTANGACPLANAQEAVEVRLVEDEEAGAGVIDKSGTFYHEEDTLYVVRKQEVK